MDCFEVVYGKLGDVLIEVCVLCVVEEVEREGLEREEGVWWLEIFVYCVLVDNVVVCSELDIFSFIECQEFWVLVKQFQWMDFSYFYFDDLWVWCDGEKQVVEVKEVFDCFVECLFQYVEIVIMVWEKVIDVIQFLVNGIWVVYCIFYVGDMDFVQCDLLIRFGLIIEEVCEMVCLRVEILQE